MENGNTKSAGRLNFRGFILGVTIAFVFLCWGLIIFFMVGDKGPPAWDFSVVEDIPGQSPYSTKKLEVQRIYNSHNSRK
jgi:hypothetical protein